MSSTSTGETSPSTGCIMSMYCSHKVVHQSREGTSCNTSEGWKAEYTLRVYSIKKVSLALANQRSIPHLFTRTFSIMAHCSADMTRVPRFNHQKNCSTLSWLLRPLATTRPQTQKATCVECGHRSWRARVANKTSKLLSKSLRRGTLEHPQNSRGLWL